MTMSVVSLSQELLISIVLLLVSFYLYLRCCRSKNPIVLPKNWPIVGMLPYIVANLHNMHDYMSVVLARTGHSIMAHRPLGSGMRFFVTCDPANVRHIFTANFPNYTKGAAFSAIFDILDGTTFTTDGEAWSQERGKIQIVLSSPRIVARMAACCRDKLENGLLPLLNHMASTSTPFDMQELIARFMFDLLATTVIGVDPGILSSDMPSMEVLTAIDTVMEVGFVRHTMPASCWKAMRLLNIGSERKLTAAHAVLRVFFSEMMERRKMVEAAGLAGNEEEQDAVFLLSSYITDPNYADKDHLRAVFLNLMLAGKDTISVALLWNFYNLAQNPDIVSTIRNELSPIASGKVAGGTAGTMLIFEPNETKSLTYLRAALYETLRLYPPGPLECKTAGVDDIMPSGHRVHAGDTILVSLYSMGRMEGIWGKDCHDYNPDRWLSKDGQALRYVPSHEFLAFNSGPRICLGKEIAVMQMTAIVAAVAWNFDVEVVEGQTIQPKMSSLLQMKNGLAVKLHRRQM